jgi:signal recognition particle GTPase
MDILLIGAPGAGKGTQAEKLSQLFTLRHVASGDLFRKAFEEQTELGLKAQRYVDLGELVPDEITIPMVMRHMEEPESIHGMLLDGYPRTLAHGPGRLGQMIAGIERWMEEHEYESIAQMKGCMSQRAVAEPAAFERANYMKALNSFDYYLP